MTHTSRNHYFDLTGLLVLGIAAFLLVSLPGGCWSDDGDGEDVDADTEAVTEPTPPPTMEIVEPEPGDIDTAEVPDENGESGDGDEESEDGENTGAEGDQSEESVAQDGTYVVQEGDTLYEIAVDLEVTMEDLMAANGIEDPNSLQVGQELTIP